MVRLEDDMVERGMKLERWRKPIQQAGLWFQLIEDRGGDGGIHAEMA